MQQHPEASSFQCLTPFRVSAFPSGAMRELRKDSLFMAEERDRERAQVDVERMDSQKKFYSELQAQAADFSSGGQGGMMKKKRRK